MKVSFRLHSPRKHHFGSNVEKEAVLLRRYPPRQVMPIVIVERHRSFYATVSSAMASYGSRTISASILSLGS